MRAADHLLRYAKLLLVTHFTMILLDLEVAVPHAARLTLTPPSGTSPIGWLVPAANHANWPEPKDLLHLKPRRVAFCPCVHLMQTEPAGVVEGPHFLAPDRLLAVGTPLM